MQEKMDPPEAIDELTIENRLIEQYLREKGVELPTDWSSLESTEGPIHILIDVKLQLAVESLSKLNNLLDNRTEAANKLISTIKVMLTEVDLRISGELKVWVTLCDSLLPSNRLRFIVSFLYQTYNEMPTISNAMW